MIGSASIADIWQPFSYLALFIKLSNLSSKIQNRSSILNILHKIIMFGLYVLNNNRVLKCFCSYSSYKVIHSYNILTSALKTKMPVIKLHEYVDKPTNISFIRLLCKAIPVVGFKIHSLAFFLWSVFKIIFLRVNKIPFQYPFGATNAAAVNFTPL